MSDDVNDFIVTEVTRLSGLRRSQGFDLAEVLLEYNQLRDMLFEVVKDACADYTRPVRPHEALDVALTLERAVSTIASATASLYASEFETAIDQRQRMFMDFGQALMHELRNRLNSVALNLQVLKEQSADQANTDLIDRVARNMSYLETAMNDIFLAIQGSLKGSPMRSLGDLIREAAAITSDYAATHGVTIMLPDALPTFAVDGARVELILMNLLTNAVKYRQGDDSERWVRIDVFPHDKPALWRVDVSDNCIGVPPGAEERIFHRHIRMSDDESIEGDGLGLSLAKDAIEQLGGEIWVHSRAEGGSVFSFTLREPAKSLDG